MLYSLATYVMYFLIYACMGYAVEVVDVSTRKGELVDRGFLKGPACPIYGVGMVIMVLCTRSFQDNPALIFLFTMAMCMTLEYVTSFVMEKVFHERWWDYSERPLNINGRICLGYSLAFGFGGLIMTYLIHPIVAGAVAGIPEWLLFILAGAGGTAVVIDFIYSTYKNLQNDSKKKSFFKRLKKR